MAGSMINLHRTLLPYCVQRMSDGGWVVLNRNYKPLGFSNGSGDWVQYEDYPISYKLPGFTLKVREQLSAAEEQSADMVFLFTDGCTPWSNAANWDAYTKKLKILCSLEGAAIQKD